MKKLDVSPVFVAVLSAILLVLTTGWLLVRAFQ